jgi:hypothetical protein
MTIPRRCPWRSTAAASMVERSMIQSPGVHGVEQDAHQIVHSDHADHVPGPVADDDVADLVAQHARRGSMAERSSSTTIPVRVGAVCAQAPQPGPSG